MKRNEVLKIMASVGRCYKDDLMAVMDGQSNANSRQLKDMCKRGWLVENRIVKADKSGNTKKVISITTKGRAYLSDKQQDDYYYDATDYVNYKFKNTETNAINRELLNSRVKLMLNRTGVKIFEKDKLSIANLLEVKKSDDSEFANAWLYDSTTPRDELIKNGVYYSLSEFRDFLSLLDSDDVSDTIMGVRARGVFLNSETLALVYTPNIYRSQTINLNITNESKLIHLVKKYFGGLVSANEISAIMITNANAVIVDMGIAGKYGHSPRDKNDNTTRSLIDVNSTMFDHIFAFPFTQNGMDSLEYFAHHTFEQWLNDSRKLYSSINHTKLIPQESIGTESLIATDTNTNKRIVFLPFFELKYLNFLHSFYEEVSILTYEDMADMISHIIRRNNAYYNLQGKELEVQYYQENGLPVGEMREYAKKKRKKSFEAITIGVTKEEKQMLKRIARMNGISMASYCRKKIRETLQQEYKQYEDYAMLVNEYQKLSTATFKPYKTQLTKEEVMKIEKEDE